MGSNALFAVLISLIINLSQGVKHGYTFSPFGLQYKMVTKKITWDAALQICEQENSRLAMPKNLEQFNFVLNKIAKPASQDQYWIGVKFANNSFYYVDGQKFKLQLWEEDEPVMSTNQACVAVKKGEMFDRRCKDKRPFVCEADLVCHVKPVPSYSLVPNSGGKGYTSCGTSTKSTSYGAGALFSGTDFFCTAGWSHYPVYIWYEFDEKAFVPGAMSFTTHSSGSYWNDYPIDYQFVGSNDKTCTKNGRWEVLGEYIHPHQGSITMNRYERAYIHSNSALLKHYRCVGIMVLNSADWGSSGGYLGLRDMKFWRKNC